MFRYYLGISFMSLIFFVFALLLSHDAAKVATIYVGFAAAFLAVAFISSGPESRW